MSNHSMGVISVHEAYSKREVFLRFKISQKFWDKMLSEGLPFTSIGHTRWVTGKDLIEYLNRHTERKNGSEPLNG